MGGIARLRARAVVQIDNEFEFRRLLYRKIGGLCTLQNAVDIRCHTPIGNQLCVVHRCKAPCVCENRPARSDRHPLAHREIDDALPVLDCEAIGQNRDRLRRVSRHSLEAAVSSSGVRVKKCVTVRPSLRPVSSENQSLVMFAGMRGIPDHSNTAKLWYYLSQHLQPLAVHLDGHHRQARHIAERLCEAFGKSCGNGIAAVDVDYRGAQAEPLSSETAEPCATIRATGKLANPVASSGTRSMKSSP